MSIISKQLYTRKIRARYFTIFAILILSCIFLYSDPFFLITTKKTEFIDNSLLSTANVDIGLTLVDLLSSENYNTVEWLSGTSLNSFLDSKLICSHILKRANRNIQLNFDIAAPDVSILGIGGTILLTNRLLQKVEYRQLLYKTLENLILDNSYEILHLTGELEELERLEYEGSQFFNKLRELKTVSMSITNLESKSISSLSIRSLLSDANDAGIKVSGVVSSRSPLYQVHQKMHIIETPQGIKIGYLAYCALRTCPSSIQSSSEYRPAIFSKESVFEIQQLKANGAKIIVVSISWSNDKYSTLPAQYAKVITHQLAISGVSIVVGYHPRIRQGHGYYKSTFVIYSAGFIFSADDSLNDTQVFRQMSLVGFDGEMEKDVFNLYQVRVSLKGDFTVRYRTVDKRTGTDRYVNDKTMKWIPACSDGDIYCVECIDLQFI